MCALLEQVTMMRSRASLLVLLALGFAVGCGGSVSDSTDQTNGDGGSAGAAGGGLAGSSGTGGSAGSGGTSASEDIVGSYDLTFGEVTQDKPLFNDLSSPSSKTNARVDIRASAGGYEAIVTPRFGAAAAMTVQATAGTVVLNGTPAVVGSDQGYNVTDTWTTFTLGRKPSGGLDGTVPGCGSVVVRVMTSVEFVARFP